MNSLLTGILTAHFAVTNIFCSLIYYICSVCIIKYHIMPLLQLIIGVIIKSKF